MHAYALQVAFNVTLEGFAVSPEEDFVVTVVGVPGALHGTPTSHKPTAAAAATEYVSDSAARGPCATFTNEINLLDLVADVQDIYRSFTTQIAQSAAQLA